MECCPSRQPIIHQVVSCTMSTMSEQPKAKSKQSDKTTIIVQSIAVCRHIEMDQRLRVETMKIKQFVCMPANNMHAMHILNFGALLLFVFLDTYGNSERNDRRPQMQTQVDTIDRRSGKSIWIVPAGCAFQSLCFCIQKASLTSPKVYKQVLAVVSQTVYYEKSIIVWMFANLSCFLQFRSAPASRNQQPSMHIWFGRSWPAGKNTLKVCVAEAWRVGIFGSFDVTTIHLFHHEARSSSDIFEKKIQASLRRATPKATLY